MIMDIADKYPYLLDLYENSYVGIDTVFPGELPFNDPVINFGSLVEKIESFIEEKYGLFGLTVFMNHIPTTKYNIVFDGNNVLLHQKKVNDYTYGRLIHLVKETKKLGMKPLVFVHKRNIKEMEKLGLKVIEEIQETPYHFNDDWFSLYYAVKNNCYLVSNDIFRDHIYNWDTSDNTNLLKIFLKQKKITMEENFSKLNFDNNNTSIIIKHEGKFYIPGSKGYRII